MTTLLSRLSLDSSKPSTSGLWEWYVAPRRCCSRFRTFVSRHRLIPSQSSLNVPALRPNHRSHRRRRRYHRQSHHPSRSDLHGGARCCSSHRRRRSLSKDGGCTAQDPTGCHLCSKHVHLDFWRVVACIFKEGCRRWCNAPCPPHPSRPSLFSIVFSYLTYAFVRSSSTRFLLPCCPSNPCIDGDS